LAPGAPADLVICDLESPMVIDAAALASKSKNSAFDGRRLQGDIRFTLADGKIIHERGEA
jgi:dihydroorotase